MSDDSSSDGSVLSCSLTLPPVPTITDVENYRDWRMQNARQRSDSSSSGGESDDDDISCSLTLPPPAAPKDLVGPVEKEKQVRKHAPVRNPSQEHNSQGRMTIDEQKPEDNLLPGQKSPKREVDYESATDDSNEAIPMPLHLSPHRERRSLNRVDSATESLKSLQTTSSTATAKTRQKQSKRETKTTNASSLSALVSPEKQRCADTSISSLPNFHKEKIDASRGKGKKKVKKVTKKKPGSGSTSPFLEHPLLKHASLIKDWDVALPAMVFLRDTSSGKSNVLSQVCGLDLPCASTTTTQCPVRITALPCMPGDAKVCQVSVKWRSNIVSNQYPNFQPVIIHANQWSEIAATISLAQAFILEHTKKKVTDDIVTVQIVGPEYKTELTVHDLPIIDEDDSLQGEISALHREYLANEQSIIVAVHAANADWQNTATIAGCKAVDPDMTRTVVVLMKPDQADPGVETELVKLLQGKGLKHQHALHLIKGRGREALDKKLSLDQFLVDEEVYFAKSEPWSSIADRSLLGTYKLREKLGAIHAKMIHKAIPAVVKQIEEKKAAAEAQLLALGDQINSVRARRKYYDTLCKSVVAKLKASTTGKGEGRHGKASAAANLHDDCAHFRDRIQEGKLATIRKVVEGGIVWVISPERNVRGQVVHFDHAFVCVDFVDDHDKNSEVLFEETGRRVPESEQIEVNDLWSDGSQVHVARDNKLYDTLRKIPPSNIISDATWLIEKIGGNRTSELGCFANIEAFNNIVEELVESDWKPHAMRLLDLSQKTLLATVEESIQESLASSVDRYPALRSAIRVHCRAVSQELMKDAHEQVKRHFEVEKHPYTQNQSLFQCIAEGRQRSIQRELEVALKLDLDYKMDTSTVKVVLDGVFKRRQQKSADLLMAEDMEVMLDSYGYVATSRVVDRTPMILWDTFRNLGSAVQQSLASESDDAVELSMQEEPSIATKRKEATKKVLDLNDALVVFASMV